MHPSTGHVWRLTAATALLVALVVSLWEHVHWAILLPLGFAALYFTIRWLVTVPLREDLERQQGILEELRDAKEFLEGTIENSADIIVSVNTEGRIWTFNRGGEEALGYDRSELIGRPVEELYIDPEERRQAIALLEETGHVRNYETRLRAKDGRIVTILLTLSRLRDAQGEVIGTIGISKDISRRRELQGELRDAREYLEGAIENSADIIITTDLEKRIRTINPAGQEVLGYRREELIGQHIESLYVDPSERHAAVALLEVTGHLRNFETRLRAKDDRVVHILLTLSRLHDRDGNVIGTIGISKDITKRRSLQEELRETLEYLSGIIENSADIIITVTPDGYIETFNRGAEEALGFGRAEVIGRRIEMLFADPRERDVAIRQLESTDNVKNYETRFLTKNGEERNVLLTLSRLRDRKGNPIGTFGISKDITRRRELQRELLQSQRYAAIGQAVTSVQHAIKNMLNSLKGGAYLVRLGMKKDNRDRVEEGWVMVEEGIDRISSLSHNMLNYARDWKPHLESAGLSDLVLEVYEGQRQAAGDQGVTLRHEVDGDLPPALCDPKLIHMAITDVVVNAIDACVWKEYPEGEEAEIVLATYLDGDGKALVVEIRDNGSGMTEEVRENIFIPFFSTKEIRGTGLGLAVTDKIITAHDGEISVESEPERGTTFRIRIPRDGSGDGRGGE